MKKFLYINLVLFGVLGFLNQANALTVSPAKLEIEADPGGIVRGEIEIFNEQAETKDFYLSYENFESRGDSGAPYFIGAKDGLATWISTNSEVKINSGERKQIPFTISVPENAKPGGYFAAVFFGSQPPIGLGGGEVSIGGKIGVLVLLRVNGAVEESAGLVSFDIKGDKIFTDSLPLTFEYQFNNNGGDRVVPKGELIIRNTFRLKSATFLANEREGSVLPNSTRRFEVTWGELSPDSQKEMSFFEKVGAEFKDFHFGWYTAKLNLVWSTSNQVADSSVHFFVVPWHLLIIVILVLSIIYFVGKIILKKYNRFIINQANQLKQ